VRALPTVCILAGGLGTRLGPLGRDTPKALIEVAGEPFVHHQLRLLAAHGAREVVICVGHRERFLVLYGDTYLPIDYAAAAAAWARSGLPAMMSVLRNDGRWDTSNADYADGRVRCYDKRAPTPQMRWIDYGLGGLDQATLDLVDSSEADLAGLYHVLASRGLLCGVVASERFHEIGTPGALRETDAHLRALPGRPRDPVPSRTALA
jgi:NDP-sugar pyrophosphorylase family protein